MAQVDPLADNEPASSRSYRIGDVARYVGVSTQYIVETGCGRLTVYRQNASLGLNGASPGQRLTLSWSPESTFVVDSLEGSE